MPISVCPIATVAASADVAWAALMAPESYGEWWDARTERVEPPGPAQARQVIAASTRALGRRWPVTIHVLGVDARRRTLDLRTTLPLGIVVRNHILVQPVDARSCRITFG